jgi:Rrf2 family transcriptional regulator, repressor of oqxAB
MRYMAKMIDLRFPTALQIMLSLALAEQEGVAIVSSTQLAEGLGANASFVRKLLVPLVQDQLIASVMGLHGGVRLGRSAETITLRDIYRSVTRDKKLWQPRPGIPHRCVVSSNVEGFFESLSLDAERAMLGVLAERTLAHSLAEVQALHKAKQRAEG